mgnify:CR=1 FL=1
MNIADRDDNGGNFGVTFYCAKNYLLFQESVQFRPAGDKFKQCFPGAVARMEFSTNDRNGWIGDLALCIDGVKAIVVKWAFSDTVKFRDFQGIRHFYNSWLSRN